MPDLSPALPLGLSQGEREGRTQVTWEAGGRNREREDLFPGQLESLPLSRLAVSFCRLILEKLPWPRACSNQGGARGSTSFVSQPAAPDWCPLLSQRGAAFTCWPCHSGNSWRNSFMSLQLRLRTCQLRTTHTSWISCENRRK